MHNLPVLLRPILVLILSAMLAGNVYSQACNNPLTTFYNTNNGQDGIMFSITAKRNIVVDSFDNNYGAGTISQILIYYKPGIVTALSAVTPGDWTLLGTANSITSAGQNNPTSIPINVNLPVAKYQTVSFYITTNGGSSPICRYTNGVGVCDSLDGNADLKLHEGYGKDYPFATSFSPRQFNGTVYYHCTANATYSIQGSTAFCNATIGQTEDYSISPPIEGPDIYWSVPSGMTIVGASNNDSITVQFTSTAPTGTICASLVGCDTIVELCQNVTANPPQADAGPDTTICTPAFQLQGNQGSGYWEVISGTGTFADSTLYNTAVSGLSIGPNQLRWNVGGFGCPYTYDDVVITVHPEPFADFDAGDECDGTSVVYQDNSYTVGGGYIANWAWDVENDGVVDYTSTGFSHLFSTYGTYQSQLIVTSNAGCSDTLVQTLDIHPNPEADFIYTPKCEGIANGFADASTIAYGTITNWIWNFDDGSGTSNLQNPTHTYVSDGNYVVTLTVVSANGCVGTYSDTALVYANPVPDFSAPARCLHDSLVFTDLSTSAMGALNYWAWDFGDGSPFDNNQHTLHYYPAADQYNIGLVVATTLGCTSSVMKTLDVYPIPVADFEQEGHCENQTIFFNDASTVDPMFGSFITQWNWDLGDGKTISKQNTFNLYQKPGPYTVKIVAKSNYGCYSLTEKEILVRPQPQANILIIDDHVCAENEVHFRDESFFDYTYDTNGVTQWKWHFGDGDSSTAQHPGHVYAKGGLYTSILWATTDYGCVDTAEKYVVIYHNPVAEYSYSTQEGCSPHCVAFIDSSYIESGESMKRTWNFGDGTLHTGRNVEHCYVLADGEAPASYATSLEVVTDFGCRDEFRYHQDVMVHSNPIADFEASVEALSVLDSTVFISDLSIGADNWWWQFGDSTGSDFQNPGRHDYTVPGTYVIRLRVSNEFGCADSVQKSIYVERHQSLYIPGTFTPNGDNHNDVFTVYGEDLEFLRLKVFDRWGRLIFVGENAGAVWDGTVDKEKAPVGTYTFVIDYRHVGQQNTRQTGTFVLLKNSED